MEDRDFEYRVTYNGSHSFLRGVRRVKRREFKTWNGASAFVNRIKSVPDITDIKIEVRAVDSWQGLE